MELQEEDSSIHDMNISRLKPTGMLDMQLIRTIASPLWIIAHTWVATLSLGGHKNRGKFLALLLSPSIKPWM